MSTRTEGSNEQHVLITEKTGLETDAVRKAEITYAEKQSLKANTPLGRRLWELRAKIITSGLPLLDGYGSERAVAERRGAHD